MTFDPSDVPPAIKPYASECIRAAGRFQIAMQTLSVIGYEAEQGPAIADSAGEALFLMIQAIDLMEGVEPRILSLADLPTRHHYITQLGIRTQVVQFWNRLRAPCTFEEPKRHA